MSTNRKTHHARTKNTTDSTANIIITAIIPLSGSFKLLHVIPCPLPYAALNAYWAISYSPLYKAKPGINSMKITHQYPAVTRFVNNK